MVDYQVVGVVGGDPEARTDVPVLGTPGGEDLPGVALPGGPVASLGGGAAASFYPGPMLGFVASTAGPVG